jgi:hypothetical protein
MLDRPSLILGTSASEGECSRLCLKISAIAIPPKCSAPPRKASPALRHPSRNRSAVSCSYVANDTADSCARGPAIGFAPPINCARDACAISAPNN